MSSTDIHPCLTCGVCCLKLPRRIFCVRTALHGRHRPGRTGPRSGQQPRPHERHPVPPRALHRPGATARRGGRLHRLHHLRQPPPPLPATFPLPATAATTPAPSSACRRWKRLRCSTGKRRPDGGHTPCLSCGACCAAFRVDFSVYESQEHGGRVPLGLIEPVTEFTCRLRGTDYARPRCAALTGTVGQQVACGIVRVGGPRPAGSLPRARMPATACAAQHGLAMSA